MSGFESVAQRKVPLEDTTITNKCKVKAQSAISRLKSGRQVLTLIFSDKIYFVIDRLSNSRQERLAIQGTFKNPSGPSVEKAKKLKCTFKTNNRQKMIILGVVREDGGKCPPIL